MPERFTDLEQISLEFPDGHRENMIVESCQSDRRNPIIKFKTIDHIDSVARLRGAYIQVPLEETAALSEGQFYVFKLIGCLVYLEDGEEIGRIRDVLSMPANDIFVVDGSDGEILIPVIQDVIAKIDPDNERVIIRNVPGLI